MADNKYVVFRLADELYGVSIGAVERILPEQRVTRLPKTPKMFLGVFDLRGETVPAVDLRMRFEFPINEGSANFIVVHTPKGRCAVRVDAVDGIVNLEEASIDENPDLVKGKEDDFISGVGKHDNALIVLLNPEHLVPEMVHKHAEKSGKLALAA